MALFNETLAGRFNEVIRRLHQIKRTPSPQVSPEITHDIVLESDRPEFHALANSTLWATRAAIGAVAATFGHAGIRNPAGSNVLCVITEISVSNTNGAAALYTIRTSNVATVLSSTAGVWRRDSRLQKALGQAGPILGIADTNAAQLGTGPMDVIDVPTADVRQFFSPPYVLLPGAELYVVDNAVNLTCDASFSGYYRQATPEELNIL